jgi:hypothetical protein
VLASGEAIIPAKRANTGITSSAKFTKEQVSNDPNYLPSLLFSQFLGPNISGILCNGHL